MVSALIGVPAGIGAGIFLPHSAFAYDLASLVAVLTLVAVRPYVLAVGLHCASVSLAFMLAGQSLGMAAERASNVILGGLIGLSVMYTVRVVAVQARCAARGFEFQDVSMRVGKSSQYQRGRSLRWRILGTSAKNRGWLFEWREIVESFADHWQRIHVSV